MLELGSYADRLADNIGQTRSMLPLRMRTVSSSPPIGQDLAFLGYAEDGYRYYCKADDGHRPLRASEYLFTSLARHLNIAVADFSVIEQEGETFFGSKEPRKLLDVNRTRDYFTFIDTDEIGRPLRVKAGYISSLLAYDIFIGNIDRSIQNFIATFDGASSRILAIDFAATTLLMRPKSDLEHDGTNTIRFAKAMKRLHGFDADSAMEMIGRIRSVPVSFVRSVIDKMQPGWLDAATTQRFLEFWGGEERSERLARLEAVITDGSLC